MLTARSKLGHIPKVDRNLFLLRSPQIARCHVTDLTHAIIPSLGLVFGVGLSTPPNDSMSSRQYMYQYYTSIVDSSVHSATRTL